MRSFLLSLLMFCATTIAWSQSLTGAALTYEKNYQTSISKLKSLDLATSKGAYESTLMQAESSLKQLKKVAPDYNTSKHDEEIASYRAALQKQQGGSNAQVYVKQLEAEMVKVRRNVTIEKSPYWEGDIARARTAITNIKKNDPNYDVSKYETEINSIETQLSGAESKAEASREANNEFRDQYETAFDAVICNSCWVMDYKPDLSAAKQKLSKMTADMNAVAESDVCKRAAAEPSSDTKSYIISPLVKDIENNRTDIQNLKSEIFSTTYERVVAENYYSLLAREQYWKANLKLFPQMAGLSQALAETQAMIRDLGSYESLLEVQRKNVESQAAKVTIPPSKRTDAAMEAEARKQFKEFEFAKGATVQRVSFTISDWAIKRHELTGVILHRELDVYLGYKAENGKCYVVFGLLVEQYNGSSYGSPVLKLNNPDLMACENMTK